MTLELKPNGKGDEDISSICRTLVRVAYVLQLSTYCHYKGVWLGATKDCHFVDVMKQWELAKHE